MVPRTITLTYLVMPATTCYLSSNFNMLTLTGQVSRHRHPNMKGYRKLTFLKVIGIVLPFPGCSVAW